MKKTVTILMLAAMLTAALTSCGELDSPASYKEDHGNKTVSEEQEISSPEDYDEEMQESEDTDIPDEKPQEDESVTTEPQPDEEDSSETDLSEHDSMLQTIDSDYIFEQGFSFAELYDLGLANVIDDGIGFAIAPADGGAGHKYYQVYSTNDGGASWTENGFYDELSGRVSHFSLDDGNIMSFTLESARSEKYPIVTYIYFDGSGVQSVELAEYLAQTLLDDGRLITDADGLIYSITYQYGYLFNIVISDENGAQLLDQDFDMQYILAYSLGN